ncbi:MAG: squalene/phytoene synthase family protein [Pseudolabrys sp.]|nr:squalene/phytoene synthase family protein [Pseudolabrys sp.]
MTGDTNISESYRHCEALVRAHDKDRYLASLFAPQDKRRFLFALYAFDIETARVRHTVREPMAGMIRLQWWHDALNGLRSEEASASPVMTALLDASAQTGTNLAPLLKVVEARQSELQNESAVGAQGALLIVAAHLLGAEEGQAVIEVAGLADIAANASAEQRLAAYAAFRRQLKRAPSQALPAFLPMALQPLLSRQPDAPQWRRQIALARAAWFGFPAA